MNGPRGASDGFSLLELVVVLAILTIAAGVVTPALYGVLTAGDGDASPPERVARVLGVARAAAVRTGTPTTVRIDGEWATFAIRSEVESDPPFRPLFPGAFAQARVVTKGAQDGRVEIRFEPDGAASGTPMRIEWAGRAQTLFVDPWTGGIHVD